MTHNIQFQAKTERFLS